MTMSMAFITRGGIEGKLFDVFQELQNGSDRAVAIVGGSIVEECLELALLAHLHRNKKITDQLFASSGAFGAFATKIHLGFLTGIYGPDAHKELSIVKDIRNTFAHSLTVKAFDAQEIADRTNKLIFGERYTEDTRSVTRHNPAVDFKNTPHGEWPVWFSLSGRDKTLATARGRFLLSIQALTYGLSIPLHTAMPRPHF